jgi:hypothetical protein
VRIEGAWLLAALAGCVGPGAGTSLRLERTTSLPPALTAWIVAAAVRQDLAAADPLRHRGVPAMALTAGAFAVQAAVDPEQRWTMLGNGRLLPAPGPGLAGPDATAFDPCAFLARCVPRGCTLAFDVLVEPLAGGGSRLSGSVSAPRAGPLLRHVGEALDRAEPLLGDDLALVAAAGNAGCCQAHAELRMSLLAAAACRLAVTQPRAAASLLAQARALTPGLPALDLAAGLLLAELGQDAAARAALREACRDSSSARREAAQQGLHELLPFATADAGRELRLAMVRELRAGRPGPSACLLQSAEAADPEPEADLLLRASLHHTRGEGRQELGCLMLRMLYTEGESEPALAAALLDADQPTLAARELMRRRAQGIAMDGDAELVAALDDILGPGLCDRIGLEAGQDRGEPALPALPAFARPEGETGDPAWRRAAALRYRPPAGL